MPRSEIIGHENIIRFLAQVRTRGTVSHAYLFAGPSSVGKTAVAARFIGELLGISQPAERLSDPFVGLRAYPDLNIIEREDDPKSGKRRKNISIEQIRALRERLGKSSLLSSWKIGLIVEAETLSDEAANALLKTLEEPAGKTVLILLSSSPGILPATVKSRCEFVRFNLVSERSIRDGLIRRGVRADEAAELAGRASGRPGAAVRELQNPEAAQGNQEKALQFVQIFGAPVWRRLRFAEAAAPEKGAIASADAAAATLGVWEAVLHDALVIAAGEPALAHLATFRDRIRTWAEARGPAAVLAALSSLTLARAALAENVPPRLAFEQVLLKI
ncbi:hypothetical protein EPN90_00170 [Patescibacteria group bacterium]|nr:MAG: hypothetical protein EPN90_00170 [Patescibacteria group bacterium]